MIRIKANMIARCCRVLLFATGIIAVLGVPVAFGAALTPADVIDAAPEYAGKLVTIEGEAIGESLRADSTHRWVNVLGGDMAIGVYMTAEDVALIERYGDHRGTGDMIEVTGTFNRACPEHAGETDIHADSVVRLSRGSDSENPADIWKGVLGVALLLLAFVEYRLFRYLRERKA